MTCVWRTFPWTLNSASWSSQVVSFNWIKLWTIIRPKWWWILLVFTQVQGGNMYHPRQRTKNCQKNMAFMTMFGNYRWTEKLRAVRGDQKQWDWESDFFLTTGRNRSAHFACPDNDLFQIFNRIGVSLSENIVLLMNINVVVWRQVKWENSSLSVAVRGLKR